MWFIPFPPKAGQNDLSGCRKERAKWSQVPPGSWSTTTIINFNQWDKHTLWSLKLKHLASFYQEQSLQPDLVKCLQVTDVQCSFHTAIYRRGCNTNRYYDSQWFPILHPNLPHSAASFAADVSSKLWCLAIKCPPLLLVTSKAGIAHGWFVIEVPPPHCPW